MSVVTLLEKLNKNGIKLTLKDGKLKTLAAPGVITSDLANLIKGNKKEIIDFLLSRQLNNSVLDIVRVDKSQPLPLSFTQQRLWFVNQLNGSSSEYNMPIPFTIEGELSVIKLQESFNQIVKKHEVLRTVYSNVDGEFVQHIKDESSVNIEKFDLINFDIKHQEELVDKITEAEVARPFNLTKDLMVRAVLIKLSQNKHKLIITFHHIAADGWSLDIFIKDFAQLYSDPTNYVQSLGIQYADFACWQRKFSKSGAYTQQLNYWLLQLAQIPQVHNVPTDYKRPIRQSNKGEVLILTLGEVTTKTLRTLAKKHSTSLFVVLYGLFSKTISDFSYQDTVVLGTPISGRNHADVEPLIGCFINNLVLVLDHSKPASIDELVQEAKRIAEDAFNHQDIPFEALVENLQPTRSLSFHPLFQIMFSMRSHAKNFEHLQLENTTFTLDDMSQVNAKFDLEVSVTEINNSLQLHWVYCSDLFKSDTIKTLSELFLLQMKTITSSQCFDNNNAVEVENAGLGYCGETSEIEECFVKMFERMAAQYSDRVAVQYGEENFTYAQLNSVADNIAKNLLSKFPNIESKGVAICLSRSFELVASIIAIHKLGAFYIPVDKMLPAARIAQIVNDSSALLMLVDSVGASLPISQVLVKELLNICEIDRLVNKDVKATLSGKNVFNTLAYVLYTSGTTGKPKGVPITHEGLANYLNHANQHYFTESSAGGVVSSSLSFDATITSLLTPLVCAKTVFLIKEGEDEIADLTSFLFERKENYLFKVTPAHLDMIQSMQEQSVCANNLHVLVVGGEQFSSSTLQRWKLKLLPNSRFINEYGPTETVVGCCYFIVDTAEECREITHKNAVPIGRAIVNKQLIILSKSGQAVPAGGVGELLIGGVGVSPGYLNNPQLNRNKFITVDLPGTNIEHAYRTGDLVRMNRNKQMEFIGRSDDQISIRGFRIEPGDVEFALNTLDEVKEAYVRVNESTFDKSLNAYLILSNGEAEEKIVDDIRSSLLGLLPSYMIPEKYFILKKAPLTANGKVDYNTLLAMELDEKVVDDDSVYSEIEIKLKQIWQKLLGKRHVGLDDNFFDIGGYSLLSAKLVGQMQGAFNQSINIKILFENPTIRQLSNLIRLNAYRLQSHTIKPQLINSLKPSSAQKRLLLIDQIGGSSQYNIPVVFKLTGFLNLSALQNAFDSIVVRHQVLRTIFQFVDEDYVPQIIEAQRLNIEHIDISGYAKSEQISQIQMLSKEESRKPFNLSRDLMVRVKIVQTSPVENIVLFTMHHIASDAWSNGILIHEFLAFYKYFTLNSRLDLPDLSIQYSDYAYWQNEWKSSTEYKEQLDYWLAQLQGMNQLHNIPLDKARPENQDHKGTRIIKRVDKQLKGRLKGLAQKEKVSLFMLLNSCFSLLVSRWSRSDEVVLAVPVASRSRPEVEHLIGFFVNTLVFRVEVDSNISYREYLQRIKTLTLNNFANESVQFEELVEHINPVRNLSYAPLCQIVFNYSEDSSEHLHLPGMKIEIVEQYSDIIKFDLELSVVERNDELEMTWRFDDSLFNRETIESAVSSFEFLLDQISSSIDLQLSSYKLVDFDTCIKGRTLLPENNSQKNLVQCFFKMAEKNPNKIAVIDECRQWTYRELNCYSNRLADYLLELGVEQGSNVALCLQSSFSFIVSMWAVLKRGAAYIPIDPQNSQQRIQTIIDDSEAKLIISTQTITENMVFLNVNLFVINDENISETWLPEYNKNNSTVQTTYSDLAYIVYTSGSTGKPKGVPVHYGALQDYLFARAVAYYPQPKDAWLLTSHCFDISVPSLFLPLLNGRTLCITSSLDKIPLLSQELQKYPDHDYLLRMTPSHSQLLTEHIGENVIISGSHTLVIGGESLDVPTLRILQKCFPNSQIFNHYGPSEAVVGCVLFDCQNLSDFAKVVPIGQPMANVELCIVDAHNNPVPQGFCGELLVSGPCIVNGYVGDLASTDTVFIKNSFTHSDHLSIYKTGDLVRQNAAGNLEYLGRKDNQIKLRGFRIELGEINHVMLLQPWVKDSITLADENCEHLYSFVTLNTTYVPTASKIIQQIENQNGKYVELVSLENGMDVFAINRLETAYLYQALIKNNSYLKYGIELSDSDCVFDIGANIGLFSVALATRFNNVRIYAYEPLTPIYDVLVQNSTVYASDQITCHPLGLSSEQGEAVFNYYPHASVLSGKNESVQENIEKMQSYLNATETDLIDGMTKDELSSVLKERLITEKIPVVLSTLSVEIDKYKVTRIDLLKINAEGSELDVLTGIEARHWSLIQQIVVETNGKENGKESLKTQIVQLLLEKGFNVHCEQSDILQKTGLVNIYASRDLLSINCDDDVQETSADLRYLGPLALNTQAISQFSSSLPDYMHPSKIIILDDFPLSRNGKVDRNALLSSISNRAIDIVIAPATTETEVCLHDIWSELFRRNKISIHANFFELGGHSLLAARVINQIKHRFEIDIPLGKFFAHQTIAELASVIDEIVIIKNNEKTLTGKKHRVEMEW